VVIGIANLRLLFVCLCNNMQQALGLITSHSVVAGVTARDIGDSVENTCIPLVTCMRCVVCVCVRVRAYGQNVRETLRRELT
jgi:hypothetical protein